MKLLSQKIWTCIQYTTYGLSFVFDILISYNNRGDQWWPLNAVWSYRNRFTKSVINNCCCFFLSRICCYSVIRYNINLDYLVHTNVFYHDFNGSSNAFFLLIIVSGSCDQSVLSNVDTTCGPGRVRAHVRPATLRFRRVNHTSPVYNVRTLKTVETLALYLHKLRKG